jgi:hypothetical protein
MTNKKKRERERRAFNATKPTKGFILVQDNKTWTNSSNHLLFLSLIIFLWTFLSFLFSIA